MTHEPKLQRAKRLIPEWTTYDNEVANLAKRVAGKTASGAGQAFEADATSLEQAKLQQEDFVEEADKAISSAEKPAHDATSHDEL